MVDTGNSTLVIAGIFSGIVGVILTAVSRIAIGEPMFDADTIVLSQYLLTTMATSIVGPAVIFIHRLQISADEMEYGVLSMNWPNSNAQLTKIGPVRAKIAYSLRNLIEGIATKDADGRSEIVANEIVHWTLHEQEANVRDFGRIQLISQTPGLSQGAEAKDTYQLITEFAKRGVMKSTQQHSPTLVCGGCDHRRERSFSISTSTSSVVDLKSNEFSVSIIQTGLVSIWLRMNRVQKRS